MIWLPGASGKSSFLTHGKGSRTKPISWQKRPSAMTDAEAHEYVVRTEAFLDGFFELLANTEPVNQSAGRQLVVIAKTIDGVDYIKLCNLATLNDVTQGALLQAIEMELKCIGAGPELDYADASAFFSELQSAIDAVLKRTRH